MTLETTSQEKQEHRHQKKRRWPKRLAIVLIALVVMSGVGFGVYVSDYYEAGDTATALAAELSETGELLETDGSIAVGQSDAEVGIVIYPGAKVDPYAYVPLADVLSDQGYYCVIAKMPFNLAFFGINAAADIMNSAPKVDQWWIAGHSLGGAMAAQFASNHPSELEGVILLAAYAASDLSVTNLDVEIIYGSNDGVLNRAALEENAGNLAYNAITHVIEGGNHAGFGDYGPQDGDGECSIGAPEQWRIASSEVNERIEARSV